MRTDNIAVLQDTLQILKDGSYEVNGKKIPLKLTRDEMKKISVFLPEEIKDLRPDDVLDRAHETKRMVVGCENIDAFSQAKISHDDVKQHLPTDRMPVLVLNLANPVHPGGGVRRGAKAQEEDLCRRSSLLLSLESRAARKYYDYNASLNTYMGSDAVMITPQVEVIKDENGLFLEDSMIVSVMTCADPMLRYGLEGMSDEGYREMMYNRATGMLKIAAHLGYKMLVLGAFGCGAFRNDARIVSNIFYKAINRFTYNGVQAKTLFDRIDFAVLDRSKDQYNFREFSRNFSDFYKER